MKEEEIEVVEDDSQAHFVFNSPLLVQHERVQTTHLPVRLAVRVEVRGYISSRLLIATSLCAYIRFASKPIESHKNRTSFQLEDMEVTTKFLIMAMNWDVFNGFSIITRGSALAFTILSRFLSLDEVVPQLRPPVVELQAKTYLIHAV